MRNREVVGGGTANQYVLDAGAAFGQPLSNMHMPIMIMAEVGTGKTLALPGGPERARPNVFIAATEEGRSCHDGDFIIDSGAMEMRLLLCARSP